MIFTIPLLACAIFLTSTFAHARMNDPQGDSLVFRAKDRSAIVWNKRLRTMRTPYSNDTKIQDCSDKFQTCFMDDRGFAFAYFRNCNDFNYTKLKFEPKVVAALHNDLWLVFDASPNYMFHYSAPKGVVGIYLGPRTSFDFRTLLRERNLRIDKFDAVEYRLAGTHTFAACEVKAE